MQSVAHWLSVRAYVNEARASVARKRIGDV